MIRQARKDKGYTQQKLAEKLGVTFTYISKIENRQTGIPPSLNLICDLAEILDLDAAKLSTQLHALDTTQLRTIIRENPIAAKLISHIQLDLLSDQQWEQIRHILDDYENL